MKPDGFLLTMLLAVAAALAWPLPEARLGPVSLNSLTQAGVAMVFFCHGVMLSPSAMRAGMTKWRVHVLVQATTFVAFPLLGLLLFHGTANVLPDELRLGFFLLCAMSSTISSSVALTAMARGDVAASVFNASISGLVGMLATPLWMKLVTAGVHHTVPLREALTGILVILALPLCMGQVLHRWMAPTLLPHKRKLALLDRGVIVLIVYSSFCESTASGVWLHFTTNQLGVTAVLVLALLGIMLVVTRSIARAAGFTRGEEITAVFCGSKKSLASGAPMAKILFAGNPGLGLIVLPLMLYHQLQLLVCTAMARRYALRDPD